MKNVEVRKSKDFTSGKISFSDGFIHYEGGSSNLYIHTSEIVSVTEAKKKLNKFIFWGVGLLPVGFITLIGFVVVGIWLSNFKLSSGGVGLAGFQSIINLTSTLLLIFGFGFGGLSILGGIALIVFGHYRRGYRIEFLLSSGDKHVLIVKERDDADKIVNKVVSDLSHS